MAALGTYDGGALLPGEGGGYPTGHDSCMGTNMHHGGGRADAHHNLDKLADIPT